MPSSLPLFLAAFFTDASLYLVFAALPFRALELGAGPVTLGILPALYAAAYTLSAAAGGRWSDRRSRLGLARTGALVFLAGALLLSRAPGTAWLFAALPVLGAGLGVFWSPLQAAIADRAGPGALGAAVSRFNVSWSLGKGAGLVTGGILTEWLDPPTAILIAAAPVLIALLLLLAGREAQAASASAAAPDAAAPAPPVPPDARPAVFLPLAWMTNALAFGTASTLNMHAPPYLLARGAGPGAFGVMLGAVFLFQTLTFALVPALRPRRATLLAAFALAVAGIAAFLVAGDSPWRVVAAAPLGVGFGLAYHASIHASLDRARDRGRAAGWHEAILGAGSSTLPLLGGVAAAAGGGLSAPFFLAAACLVAGALVCRRLLPAAGATGSPA